MNAALEIIAREERTAVERYISSLARTAYLGDKTALCRVLGCYYMQVPTDDLSLAPHLMLDGYWEMWITQVVARHVKPGMNCIDVGANVGYYTLLLADLVGEEGYVQAWEPQKHLVDLLKASLAMNGLGAHVVWAAAGREWTTANLTVPGKCYGSASIVPSNGGETIHVRRIEESLLHSSCRDTDGAVRRLDFVKIDAEGYEHAVWDGLGAQLDHAGITVLMEFSPGICDEPGVLLDKVVAAGFPLRRVSTDGAIEAISREAALENRWEMLWLQRPA